MQNIISKLEDEFETSSVASQHLEIDLKTLRELKSLANPPQMVGQVTCLAFSCVTLEKKNLAWGDCKKNMANPQKAINLFQNFDYSRVTKKDLNRLTKIIESTQLDPSVAM